QVLNELVDDDEALLPGPMLDTRCSMSCRLVVCGLAAVSLLTSHFCSLPAALCFPLFVLCPLCFLLSAVSFLADDWWMKDATRSPKPKPVGDELAGNCGIALHLNGPVVCHQNTVEDGTTAERNSL